MPAQTVPERMTALETRMEMVVSDLAEVKADVKTLVRATAVEAAATLAHSKSRAQMGVWVRSVIPWTIAGISVAVNVMVLIAR